MWSGEITGMLLQSQRIHFDASVFRNKEQRDMSAAVHYCSNCRFEMAKGEFQNMMVIHFRLLL
jgi:hypothetical protein